ncbi:MAG: hypothetical protein N4A71_06885 [Carboxylicivirga sp.]|jgi:hypothetical protein|nr:hypothetical protein [Carboxylicivirga sp.]
MLKRFTLLPALILIFSHIIIAQDIPEKVLFIVRHQYAQDHHNTATLFQTNEINTHKFKPGSALKILNTQTKEVTTLLESKTGVLRDPEVSFDGSKIIFSYRKSIDDDYHIYEINADGSKLKQLTFARGISDIDPLYLPNDQIVFSSTREPKYCMCNRHIMANLYRMNADGSNIIQVGKSTLFEGHSALMNDGRIIYDRWEYVDRNFGDAQGLWTVNPDGTKHAIFYGNNMNSPGGIIDPRPLPNSNLMLCIFGSCHDRPWGALALIDRSLGVDGEQSVVKIWPEQARELIGKGNWDTFMQLDERYEDPFPISQNQFLVSKSVGQNTKNRKMGLYLTGMDGNETLLYEDLKLGCFDPMPLAPRYRPIDIPDARRYDGSSGYFYVQNVYEGTHMKGIEQGEIKYLRVVESPEKRTYTSSGWNGQGQQAPGVNWHSFENKRLLGTVPVEEDGSVYFEAPSNRYMYFQLLDKDKKMVQSMRSGVMVQAGETNGCIGCHEDRLKVPPVARKMPLALSRKPAQLRHANDTVLYSYVRNLQPVFDKHCVRCHDFGKGAGNTLILAGDRNPYFNASYIDLHFKHMIRTVGGGPAEIKQAKSWGSHASHIIEVLEEGHHGITLTKGEMRKLYTWVDLNGVYYPYYESAYPDNPVGRSPLDAEELSELTQLTGVNFNELASHNRKMGPQIAFERPHLSPCLKHFTDTTSTNYQKALAIIKKGKKRLLATPRADMPGFKPSEKQKAQLDKYMQRLNIEANNQKAINEGNLVYDEEKVEQAL